MREDDDSGLEIALLRFRCKSCGEEFTFATIPDGTHEVECTNCHVKDTIIFGDEGVAEADCITLEQFDELMESYREECKNGIERERHIYFCGCDGNLFLVTNNEKDEVIKGENYMQNAFYSLDGPTPKYSEVNGRVVYDGYYSSGGEFFDVDITKRSHRKEEICECGRVPPGVRRLFLR